VSISTIMSGSDTERAEEAQGANKQAGAGPDPGSAPSHPPQPVLWAGDPVALPGGQDDDDRSVYSTAGSGARTGSTADGATVMRVSSKPASKSQKSGSKGRNGGRSGRRRSDQDQDAARRSSRRSPDSRRDDHRDDRRRSEHPEKVAVTEPTRATTTTTMTTGAEAGLWIAIATLAHVSILVTAITTLVRAARRIAGATHPSAGARTGTMIATTNVNQSPSRRTSARSSVTSVAPRRRRRR
jgi:hypothetical protein